MFTKYPLVQVSGRAVVLTIVTSGTKLKQRKWLLSKTLSSIPTSPVAGEALQRHLIQETRATLCESGTNSHAHIVRGDMASLNTPQRQAYSKRYSPHDSLCSVAQLGSSAAMRQKPKCSTDTRAKFRDDSSVQVLRSCRGRRVVTSPNDSLCSVAKLGSSVEMRQTPNAGPTQEQNFEITAVCESYFPVVADGSSHRAAQVG